MKFDFMAVKLSGLIVIVFLLQFISGFTEVFILNGMAWIQVWRFLTSIFLHGGPAHLFFNLFSLILFGSLLEKIIGSRRFLLVFFLSGILANLVSVNFYNSSLGASGAIFGVIGALIVIRPGLPVWAFGMPMPIFIAGILWVIFDTIGTVGFITGSPIDNTGNIAHLSGIFFGFILGGFYRKKRYKRNPHLTISEGRVRNWEDVYLK